jgi:hypothetical protein
MQAGSDPLTPTLADEASPALRVYGPHARLVAALVREHPKLAARLLCAPRRAVHATGAYLGASMKSEEAVLVCHLSDEDPRSLLRIAVPNAPARLYRTLDRAGDIVQEANFYARLGRSPTCFLAVEERSGTDCSTTSRRSRRCRTAHCTRSRLPSSPIRR